MDTAWLDDIIKKSKLCEHQKWSPGLFISKFMRDGTKVVSKVARGR